MLEWLKRHAWKACKRLKRFGGSNPPLSAKTGRRTLTHPTFVEGYGAGRTGLNAEK